MDNDREETAARIVMQHILGTSYSEVMFHLQDELTAEQKKNLKNSSKSMRVDDLYSIALVVKNFMAVHLLSMSQYLFLDQRPRN